MMDIRILRSYFVGGDEMPLCLMSDGEFGWVGDFSFFLHFLLCGFLILSLLLIASWRLGRRLKEIIFLFLRKKYIMFHGSIEGILFFFILFIG
jgi:hypothetical protein